MIANGIIRTKDRELWWPTNRLLSPSSRLTSSTWKGDLQSIAIKRAKRNVPMSTARGRSQANVKGDTPMCSPSRSTILHRRHLSVPATPTASVYAPHQLNDILLSPHLHAPYSCSASEVTVGAASIPSEHEGHTAVVGTDSGALISPDPLHIEEMEGMDYVVEEPEEPENGSSTPPPKIFARSATGGVFRYAPPAAQGTLQDGHDIELVVATPDTK